MVESSNFLKLVLEVGAWRLKDMGIFKGTEGLMPLSCIVGIVGCGVFWSFNHIRD